VFEGPLSATRQRQQWIRLEAGDFPAAVRELRQAGLVMEERDAQFITLTPGTGTDAVVRLLVQRGIAVYEIAHEAETLEGFYLSLMKEKASG
jgi:hypothetical protein